MGVMNDVGVMGVAEMLDMSSVERVRARPWSVYGISVSVNGEIGRTVVSGMTDSERASDNWL